MNFSKADLPDLKWSLLAFVLGLGVSGALVSISSNYEAQARIERQDAQAQLSAARTQLAAAESDQENMATYAREYNALAAQQIIGDEQRLDWIEGLEKLRQQGFVLDFNYTIAPQQAYTPEPPLNTGDLLLKRSMMTMQIDLLHEEQLMHLLGAMRARMKGWFMLDGCSISRANPTAEESTLKGECSGGWLTMTVKSAP